MKKIYYLKTCDTCRKIISQIKHVDEFELQDIKDQDITVKQLEEMYGLSGSYEKLFSKRAKLYKEMGLKDEQLGEEDFKKYILEHYTFLARPVVIFDGLIFIGNSPKNIEQLLKTLNG